MKIDILYLAWNRRAFTRLTLKALRRNTDWSMVNRLVIYDDHSSDGSQDDLDKVARGLRGDTEVEVRHAQRLGPVAIMNHFLQTDATAIFDEPAPVFAKIDNDTLLPPGWLGEALPLFLREELDLLGIEPRGPFGPGPRQADPCEFIGGIGLMRRAAFPPDDLPVPDGRFGFTHWQERHEHLRKAWLTPAIRVCLLNRLRFEPFTALNADYVARGWQRDWPEPYPEDEQDAWMWQLLLNVDEVLR